MRDRSWLVYIHRNNINGKVYVGITHFVKNPNRRWNNGKGYKHCIKFYNAILKYGWDNFSHIELCRTPKLKACLLEQALISLYKSKELSYNIGLGGEGSTSFSIETRNKLSNKLKGRKIKKESIESMVLTRRQLGTFNQYPKWLWENRDNKGENNPFYGRKHSKETIKKKQKSVLQYDKFNNLIAEFPSIKDAAESINTRPTTIVGP